MSTSQNKAVERHLSQAYTMVVEPGEYTTGGIGFTAYHPELPGCRGSGTSVEEAKADLEEAKRLYIETLVSNGVPVPKPKIYNGGLGVKFSPSASENDIHTNYELATVG